MTFAEKIVNLRKQKGLSQEELAYKMHVSRQAVSKWESSVSSPDTEKIIKLSKLFEVSIDYLLKDEIEENQNVKKEENNNVNNRNIMDETENYLRTKRKTSTYTAVAVVMFLLSPHAYMYLQVFANSYLVSLTNDIKSLYGVIAFIIYILIPIILIVISNLKSNKVDYIKSKTFIIDEKVANLVNEERELYRKKYNIFTVLGSAICIIPIIVNIIYTVITNLDYFSGLYTPYGEIVTYYLNVFTIHNSSIYILLTCCVGVFLLVKNRIRWESYNTVLKKNEHKVKSKLQQRILLIYKLLVGGLTGIAIVLRLRFIISVDDLFLIPFIIIPFIITFYVLNLFFEYKNEINLYK